MSEMTIFDVLEQREIAHARPKNTSGNMHEKSIKLNKRKSQFPSVYFVGGCLFTNFLDIGLFRDRGDLVMRFSIVQNGHIFVYFFCAINCNIFSF